MKAKDLMKVLSQYDENIDVSICIEDGYGENNVGAVDIGGDAKSIHPDGRSSYRKGYDDYNKTWCYAWFSKRKDGRDYLSCCNTWCGNPLDVTATYIGEADSSLKEGTVVCASFNAG